MRLKKKLLDYGNVNIFIKIYLTFVAVYLNNCVPKRSVGYSYETSVFGVCLCKGKGYRHKTAACF